MDISVIPEISRYARYDNQKEVLENDLSRSLIKALFWSSRSTERELAFL